jgi:hypothetical protein
LKCLLPFCAAVDIIEHRARGSAVGRAAQVVDAVAGAEPPLNGVKFWSPRPDEGTNLTAVHNATTPDRAKRFGSA